MSDDEMMAYLDEQRVLNVATIGPTGDPHLVAMWYVMRDGRPSFWAAATSQKIVNLRRDPRVSALVESGESYGQLRGVELRGTARIIEDPDQILDIGAAIGIKYTGPAAARPDARPFLEAQAHRRVGVEIDITHISSWDHHKLAADG